LGAVGAAFDDFDFVDDALDVAVGCGFVEVGQQFATPAADAFGEGVERWQAGVVGRRVKLLEALLAVAAIGGPIDGAEGFLRPTPRRG
jgi:hypothetical protein